jgi:hypothetical protein
MGFLILACPYPAELYLLVREPQSKSLLVYILAAIGCLFFMYLDRNTAAQRTSAGFPSLFHYSLSTTVTCPTIGSFSDNTPSGFPIRSALSHCHVVSRHLPRTAHKCLLVHFGPLPSIFTLYLCYFCCLFQNCYGIATDSVLGRY